jgi:hypothetical protein
MDKTCIEIRELMALSSDATPNERIAIEAHVPVCSECAVEHARLQAMLGNLALLREGTMPPGASERIWRGVQSAVPGSRRPRILGWTARAAAVLVIGLAVGYSASSVAGLKSAPASKVDDVAHDDPPYTLGSGKATAAFGSSEDQPPPRAQAWFLHHLPSVSGILDASVVRF